ncbi:hypothetical protein KSP40_PGU004584 [Platanthera guangdongensis]|uniref:E3 ubiquitin-protein ligase n=1 Tax=Platanthera guangdongensis TaxID=2320717 RepID=A0ABR2LHJ9_9ASPA
MGTISACVFWKNQSMLSLLVSLMRKHKEENNNINAETRQCNISSLIEMLLKKFAQLSDKCMTELKHLAPDVIGNVSQVNSSVESSALVSEMERKAKARQRQAAILVCFCNLLSIREKMKTEQSKFIDSISSNNLELVTSLPEVDDVKEESVPVCSLCHDPDSGSPLCFLILLQV